MSWERKTTRESQYLPQKYIVLWLVAPPWHGTPPHPPPLNPRAISRLDEALAAKPPHSVQKRRSRVIVRHARLVSVRGHDNFHLCFQWRVSIEKLGHGCPAQAPLSPLSTPLGDADVSALCQGVIQTTSPPRRIPSNSWSQIPPLFVLCVVLSLFVCLQPPAVVTSRIQLTLIENGMLFRAPNKVL